MPTVYERIKANRYAPTTDQKIKIGKQIAEAYFKLPKKFRPPLAKKQSSEPNGTFIVWIYPKRFVKQMDAIITKVCNDAGIQRLKRRRIVKTK